MKQNHCIDCGYDIIGKLRPPYSERKTINGGKMTYANAKALFVDSRGGRCCTCYLAYVKKEVQALMKRHGTRQIH
jgi:hypothetical protein